MNRQEIEQAMDELAPEYYDTHDPEIPEEIFELARQLLLIRLFQHATKYSVGACRVRLFLETCANFSVSSPAKRPVSSI